MWRETISSTANLGFRIEGIKKDDLKSKDFKTIKSREEIMDMFKEFCAGYPHALVSLQLGRDSHEGCKCEALRLNPKFFRVCVCHITLRTIPIQSHQTIQANPPTDAFPLQPKYIQRLKAIRATLEHSEFFRTHEIIGSSLLFLHDRRHASCWLIDFAKTDTLPDDIKITHKKNWEVGNHEDGYLIGLNNIIDLFAAVAKEMDKQDSDQSSSESSG